MNSPDISALKPGMEVFVAAKLVKVDMGEEGGPAVVQVELEQAEGFALVRTTSVVLPSAAVAGYLPLDEPVAPEPALLGGLGRTRDEVTKDALQGARP